MSCIVPTMESFETAIEAPLTQWEDGSNRITGTRVPIDAVLHHFKLGSTAEQIGYKFATLRLADIYGVIFYYLANTDQVETYLCQQQAEGDAVQRRVEADPEYQHWKADTRERLLKRRSERNALMNPAAD